MSCTKNRLNASLEALKLVIRHERQRSSCEASAMDTHRALTRKKLLADGTATEAELDAIDQQMADEIEAAYEFADSSPYPDPSEAFTDVYSEDNERCVAR